MAHSASGSIPPKLKSKNGRQNIEFFKTLSKMLILITV